MANEPILGQRTEPPTAKMGDLVEWDCQNCKNKAHFEVPNIEVVNQRSFSAYHFSHETPQTCEHCGQPHIFMLGGLVNNKMAFSFQPVMIKDQSRIIQAPAGVIPDKILREG